MAESELKRVRLRAEAQKAEVAAERARYDFESLKSSAAEVAAEREEFEARLEELEAYNRLLEKRLDHWEGPTPGVEEDGAEAEARRTGIVGRTWNRPTRCCTSSGSGSNARTKPPRRERT